MGENGGFRHWTYYRHLPFVALYVLKMSTNSEKFVLQKIFQCAQACCLILG